MDGGRFRTHNAADFADSVVKMKRSRRRACERASRKPFRKSRRSGLHQVQEFQCNKFFRYRMWEAWISFPPRRSFCAQEIAPCEESEYYRAYKGRDRDEYERRVKSPSPVKSSHDPKPQAHQREACDLRKGQRPFQGAGFLHRIFQYVMRPPQKAPSSTTVSQSQSLPIGDSQVIEREANYN